MSFASIGDIDEPSQPVDDDLQAHPVLPGETVQDYDGRRNAEDYQDQSTALALQRQQDQQATRDLRNQQAQAKVVRVQARHIFGQAGVPVNDDGYTVQPVTDTAGQPITNYDARNKVGWDSFGNPQSVQYQPDGTVKLADPYANAPTAPDKDGNLYAAPPGLPWRDLGMQDPDIVEANQGKATASAAAALGAQASIAARDTSAMAKDVKQRQKAVAQVVPEVANATDIDSAHAAVDAHFNEQYAAPEANVKKGWFNTGDLTDSAKALRSQIDQQKAQAHSALDDIDNRQQALATAQQQTAAVTAAARTVQNAALVRKLTAARARGVDIPTIPGIDDVQPPAGAGAGPASGSDNVVEAKNPDGDVAHLQKFDPSGPAYQATDDGAVAYDPTRIKKGLAEAYRDGRIDRAKFVELAPKAQAAQDALDAQAKLLANDTVASKLKAAGYGAGKGAAFLAGAPVGAGIGAEIGAFGGPFAEVTIPVGSAIGGLVTGGLAAWGADKLIRKLGQYSDTVKGFTDAADAHPYYDAAGNLIAFGAGLPKAAMKGAGALIAGEAGTGAKTASQLLTEQMGAAKAAGATVDTGAVAKAALNPANLRQAVGNAYANSGGGLATTVSNFAEEASRRALAGASTADIAKAIGYRVGGMSLGMAAVDTALKEGSKALGFSNEGQTLGGLAQSALIGAFISGHGYKFPDTPPAQMADIISRAKLRQDAGIAFDQPVSPEQMPAGVDSSGAAALAKPLTPREMILLGAFEDQTRALVNSGKIKAPSTVAEHEALARGATGKEVEHMGRLLATGVEIKPQAASETGETGPDTTPGGQSGPSGSNPPQLPAGQSPETLQPASPEQPASQQPPAVSSPGGGGGNQVSPFPVAIPGLPAGQAANPPVQNDQDQSSTPSVVEPKVAGAPNGTTEPESAPAEVPQGPPQSHDEELAQREQQLAGMDPKDPMRPLIEGRAQMLRDLIGEKTSNAGAPAAGKWNGQDVGEQPVVALKMDDGSVMIDPASRIHATAIENLGVDPAQVAHGGFVVGNRFVKSGADAERIATAAKAQARVIEKRAQRLSQNAGAPAEAGPTTPSTPQAEPATPAPSSSVTPPAVEAPATPTTVAAEERQPADATPAEEVRAGDEKASGEFGEITPKDQGAEVEHRTKGRGIAKRVTGNAVVIQPPTGKPFGAHPKDVRVVSPKAVAAQPAESSTEPAEPVLPPKKTTPKANRFAVRHTQDTFADDPVISTIAEHGGLMSKTTAKAKWPADKWAANKGEWDDVPRLHHPTHNSIYKPGGLQPDEMAQVLKDAHLLPESGTVADMWAAIERSSRGAASLRKQVSAHNRNEADRTQQAKRFDKTQAAPVKGTKPIPVDDLQIGDQVQIGTEKMKVIAIDPDTFDVTLEDHEKYGVQAVQNGTVVYGRLKKASPAASEFPGAAAKPDLALEQQTEEGINAEREAAQAKAMAKPAKPAPTAKQIAGVEKTVSILTKAAETLAAAGSPKVVKMRFALQTAQKKLAELKRQKALADAGNGGEFDQRREQTYDQSNERTNATNAITEGQDTHPGGNRGARPLSDSSGSLFAAGDHREGEADGDRDSEGVVQRSLADRHEDILRFERAGYALTPGQTGPEGVRVDIATGAFIIDRQKLAKRVALMKSLGLDGAKWASTVLNEEFWHMADVSASHGRFDEIHDAIWDALGRFTKEALANAYRDVPGLEFTPRQRAAEYMRMLAQWRSGQPITEATFDRDLSNMIEFLDTKQPAVIEAHLQQMLEHRQKPQALGGSPTAGSNGALSSGNEGSLFASDPLDHHSRSQPRDEDGNFVPDSTTGPAKPEDVERMTDDYLSGRRNKSAPSQADKLAKTDGMLSAEQRLAGKLGAGEKIQPSPRMQALAQAVARMPKEEPTVQERAKEVAQGIKGRLAEIKRSLTELPPHGPVLAATNVYQADLQRASKEAQDLYDAVVKKAPDALTREAITNWRQAGGDLKTLSMWAQQTSDPKLKTGYRAAMELSPDHKALARDISAFYREKLALGIEREMLQEGIANYATQIWVDDSGKRLPTAGGGRFKQQFSFANPRQFDTFFEGEQLAEMARAQKQPSFKPLTKDAASLLGIYSAEFNKVLAARDYIRHLAEVKAADGRKVVAPSTVFKKAVVLKEGDPTDLTSGAFHLDRMGESGDYKLPAHPAFQKWRWTEPAYKEDPEGLNPPVATGGRQLMIGNLVVHPDHYRFVNNVLGESAIQKWLNEPSEGFTGAGKATISGILRANGLTKGLMFAGSPFHMIHVGKRALGNWVNPFHLGDELDFSDPMQRRAIEHGLVVHGDRLSQEQFVEGLGSDPWLKKVPGIGPALSAASEFTFHEYIPRMKMKTYAVLLKRKLKAYAKELASGKVTVDQLEAKAASETNNIFGHLNYAGMGRNPTVQHVASMAILAPDFTESTFRGFADAFAKHGGEARRGLLTLAIGTLVAAKVINALLDNGDAHLDHPFSVVVGTREYSLRSPITDIAHLYHDWWSFASGRQSPLLRGLIEAGSGKNWRSEPVSWTDAARDIAGQPIPMTLKGLPGVRAISPTDAKSPIKGWEQFVSSLGFGIRRYSPSMDVNKWADAFLKSKGQQNPQTAYPQSKFANLKYALFDAKMDDARKEVAALVQSQGSAVNVAKGLRASLFHPVIANQDLRAQFYKSLTPDQRAVYAAAAKERAAAWSRFESISGTAAKAPPVDTAPRRALVASASPSKPFSFWAK